MIFEQLRDYVRRDRAAGRPVERHGPRRRAAHRRQCDHPVAGRPLRALEATFGAEPLLHPGGRLDPGCRDVRARFSACRSSCWASRSRTTTPTRPNESMVLENYETGHSNDLPAVGRSRDDDANAGDNDMNANDDAEIAAEAPSSEDGADTAAEGTSPDGSATDQARSGERNQADARPRRPRRHVRARPADPAARAGRSGRTADLVEGEAPAAPWRVDTEAVARAAVGARHPRRRQRQGRDRPDRRLRARAAGLDRRSIKTIGGGLRPGELLLIGGAQGTGKTTMALQMARNVAVRRPGERAVHLLRARRAVPAEPAHRAWNRRSPHLPHKTGAIKIQDVRKEILGTWAMAGRRGCPTSLANNPRSGPRSTGSPATARTCS